MGHVCVCTAEVLLLYLTPPCTQAPFCHLIYRQTLCSWCCRSPVCLHVYKVQCGLFYPGVSRSDGSISWWQPSWVRAYVCPFVGRKASISAICCHTHTSVYVVHLCASVHILTTICTASGFIVSPSRLPPLFQLTALFHPSLLLSALLLNQM